MKVKCPSCGETLAQVDAVERLNLTVHCPYDGKDFGVTVAPKGVRLETPEEANPPAGGWRPA
jgi:hypothetical protein